MKKSLLLISAALMVSASLLMLTPLGKELQTKSAAEHSRPLSSEEKLSSLNYFITQSDQQRSFDPKDSDFSPNAVHMRHLVGTLLAFNSVNTFVPYLVESWKTDDSYKQWKFRFRSGLHCEDGTDINSQNYKTGLQLAFRNHAPSPTTPVFSLLKGWENFLNGKSQDLEGIKAPDSKTLIFDFSEPPSGVEAYLSMPYFGFYCPGNFDSTGKWKSKEKIISSGPYYLKSFDWDSDIISIGLRIDWPLNTNRDAPKEVLIRVAHGDSIYKSPSPHTIVEGSFGESDEVSPDWQLLRGAVTISSNIVLNPKRPPFSDLENRRIFANTLRKIILDEKGRFRWTVVSSAFFPFTTDVTRPAEQRADSFNEASGNLIAVEDLLASNERGRLIKDTVESAISRIGLRRTLVDLDRAKLSRDEFRLKRSREADVYFIHVDKGGAAEPWVIRMMFCSELGVSFPDPSGRICALTEKFEGRPITPEEYERFGREFEKIIEEDSVVIPITHRGQNWLYSKDLDISGISANASITDFQKVRLK